MSTRASREPGLAPLATPSQPKPPGLPLPPRSRRARNPALLVAVCLAVATASLVLPVTLAYDSWAWLTWGREIGQLALDTTRGPSWKPLPVMGTSALTPFGELAVPLWLVLTRTIGLLTLVAAYRLAARFAGWVAGAVAVALLLVTPEGAPRYVRLVLEGHTAPLTAALLLWAVERHLAGRHSTAFLLTVALALDRPEAWPFLGVYALWLWKRDPALRRMIMLILPVIPLLWFGGDWLGSGSPWHGADAARVVADEANRTTEALVRVADVVAVPAWVLSGFALYDERRRGGRTLLGIALLAVSWFTVVVLMSTVFGYAALTRFLLPGAALMCVLAGIGVVRAFESVASSRGRVALVAVLVLVGVPFVGVRAGGVSGVYNEMQARYDAVAELDDVVEGVGGRDALVSCGRVAIDDLGVPRVALAWKLEVPIAAVRWPLGARGGTVFTTAGGMAQRRAARDPDLVELASTSQWVVYGSGCEGTGGAVAASALGSRRYG